MSTFSKAKGVVEANKDDGSVSAVHDAWLYIHLVGFFPLIHRFNAWFVNYVIGGWVAKLKSLPVFMLGKEGREKSENMFSVSQMPLSLLR